MSDWQVPPPNQPSAGQGWGQQQPGYGPPPGYQPQPAYGPPPGPPGRNWFGRHKILTGLGIFVVLVIIGSVAAATGGGNGNNTASAAQPVATGSSPTASAATLGGRCNEPGLTAYNGTLTCGTNGKWQIPRSSSSTGTGSSTSTSTGSSTGSSTGTSTGTSTGSSTGSGSGSQPPAAPQYTTAQKQAIDSAESYLNMGSGFSKAGLYHQLHSQYGAGFSAQLAHFAVNHIKVNWFHQAVLSARSYMKTEPGWSYSGLVQQLDSPYGGQFTVAQAEHAARKVGL